MRFNAFLKLLFWLLIGLESPFSLTEKEDFLNEKTVTLERYLAIEE